MRTLISQKIYVVGGNLPYANWMLGQTVDTIEEATLVVFTGGEDVTPSIYHAKKHPQTTNNLYRDNSEMEVFNRAKVLNLPMVGICRGAQLICCLSGGSLVQHQENPLYVHNIKTYDEQTIPITSTHHQAMYPYSLQSKDYQLLGWTKGISKFHENGDQREMQLLHDKEAEIVYFHNSNALCIQGHPEQMYNKKEYITSIQYLQTMLNKFLWKVYAQKRANLYNFNLQTV